MIELLLLSRALNLPFIQLSVTAWSDRGPRLGYSFLWCDGISWYISTKPFKGYFTSFSESCVVELTLHSRAEASILCARLLRNIICRPIHLLFFGLLLHLDPLIGTLQLSTQWITLYFTTSLIWKHSDNTKFLDCLERVKVFSLILGLYNWTEPTSNCTIWNKK